MNTRYGHTSSVSWYIFCRLFAAFRTLPGTNALPEIQLKRVRETECRSRHSESTYITTQRLQMNTPLADHDQDVLG